ncbi:MAG: NYN domain-containing protein [Candidatus Njordarchaeota archaeon]
MVPSTSSSSKKTKRKKSKKLALFIDLNSARDLQTILRAYELAQEYGEIVYACTYAEEKDLSLIGTINIELEKRGIDIKVTVGPCEITMALDIVELAYQNKIDYITVCTRRDVFIPAFVEAKKLGTKIIVLSPVSAPTGLQEISDEIEIL